MLRKWPIVSLLCLAFVVAGLAIAGEPASSFAHQSPAVVTLLVPAALPVANPQRQLATTLVSHKHSLVGRLLDGCNSPKPFTTAADRPSGESRKLRLAVCGIKNYRAPPSPRSV